MADIQVKDLSKSKEKYGSRGNAAGPAYTEGVNTTSKDQNALAIAAKEQWAQGVATAAANDLFAKGLHKAGNDKWKRNAATKGGLRYGPGVMAAKDDWANGFQPYADTLKALNLPPRAPRGDPGNAGRSSAVAAALHAKRLGG